MSSSIAVFAAFINPPAHETCAPKYRFITELPPVYFQAGEIVSLLVVISRGVADRMRAGLLILCGVIVGAGGAVLLRSDHEEATSIVATPPPERLSCESELEQHRERIAQLERRVAASSASVPESLERPEFTTTPPSDPSVAQEEGDAAVKWRVSAISKFIDVTDEQKERLEQKYREEKNAQEEGRESQAETLEAQMFEAQMFPSENVPCEEACSQNSCCVLLMIGPRDARARAGGGGVSKSRRRRSAP